MYLVVTTKDKKRIETIQEMAKYVDETMNKIIAVLETEFPIGVVVALVNAFDNAFTDSYDEANLMKTIEVDFSSIEKRKLEHLVKIIEVEGSTIGEIFKSINGEHCPIDYSETMTYMNKKVCLYLKKELVKTVYEYVESLEL